ncbi:MAG: HNH endonuclease [Gammaproteobacteria bacterium]|nr:HNH endonuclease [Gammaproteobacteria bacterium]MYJ74894.1 HNH endonuclease [Gammaproteobacteria bacterium]
MIPLGVVLVVLVASQQPCHGLWIEPECRSPAYKESDYRRLYNQVRSPHLLDGLLRRDGYLGRYESDGTVRSCADLTIDHVVSTAEAHDSGGCKWRSSTRRAFAVDPANLILACRSTNSRKGKRDAAEWSRFSEEQHCWYARTVIQVKRFWGLSVDTKEKEALATMLSTCSP